MTPDDIPAAVLEFLDARINSVPELETLLIMSADERVEWSVADIAARTYVTPKAAFAVLNALKRHRLVGSDRSGTVFRFSPASDAERQVVLQPGIAYRDPLIPIATFIHRKAAVAVQEFA